MITTYEEALEYIHGTYAFGIKLGLENIGILLDYMDNPQDRLKFVHVAGTNGKGSTSNMISKVLQNAGYKVGLYISPYLEEFTERIQINGQQISRDDLAQVTNKVKEQTEKMMKDGHPHPSEFELVTAIGFQYFSEKDVDIVVLEVGMGGRFDATNIIKQSEVSIITTIGMDHLQYLGDTIKKIAFEKAGIIKPAGQVVLSPQSSEATQEIIRVCEERKATIYTPNLERLVLKENSLDGQKLHYKSTIWGDFDLTLSLLGEHQINNCVSALAALEILKTTGYNITISHIQNGMSSIVFPGRFEKLKDNPTIIIDGAHNEAGIDALVNTANIYVKRKVKLVLGILADKDFSSMVKKLSTIADEIYTVTPNNDRAMKSTDLAEFIKKTCPDMSVYPLSSIKEGAEIAKSAPEKDIFIFAGSLYMIGEARTHLLNNY